VPAARLRRGFAKDPAISRSEPLPALNVLESDSDNAGAGAAASPPAAAARPGAVPGKFLTGGLMRHVAVMTLTSSIGLLAMFLVDFADLFFISQLGDPMLTAGMGFAASLLFLNSALNIGLMITISALGARRIGMGRGEEARALLTEVMLIGIVLSVAISLGFWLVAPQAMTWLGATGSARDAAIHYIRIVAPFGPVTVIGMVCSGLLRAHGDARKAMNVTLAMAAGNAIFDPILMFGLGLGFTGAAFATVISIFMMTATGIYPVLRDHGGFAWPSRASFMANLADIRAIMGPAVLTNLATPIGGMIAFRLIAHYGESAVAAYAVIGRIVPLAFCLLFSLSGSVGPIIGQNYGAGQLDRVRGAIDRAVLFAGGYTLLVWPLLLALAMPIADIFGLVGLGPRLLWLFALVVAPLFFFNGVLFIANAAFNNLDRANWSTALNWGRNTLGVLPFATAGGMAYGAPGILVGPAIGGALFGVLAFWLTRRRLGQLDPAVR